MKFKLWDASIKAYLPNGKELSHEVMVEEYPFCKNLPTLLGFIDDGMTIVGDIDPLPVAREAYKIDSSKSDGEAIAEIERIRNAPPPKITPEDRPMTQGDMQFLLQQMTELELTVLEANAGV